jgi:endoribonuclease Dicer
MIWVVEIFIFLCVVDIILKGLQKEISENTIAYLETRSGKTLTAIMLLRSYACHLCKSSPYIVVFFVSKVILVSQVCKKFDLFYDNFAY